MIIEKAKGEFDKIDTWLLNPSSSSFIRWKLTIFEFDLFRLNVFSLNRHCHQNSFPSSLGLGFSKLVCNLREGKGLYYKTFLAVIIGRVFAIISQLHPSLLFIVSII